MTAETDAELEGIGSELDKPENTFSVTLRAPEVRALILRIRESETLLATHVAAVTHVLNRVQTEPEFRWHMLDTESFDKLVAAEAARTGDESEVVKRRRETDLQPSHRSRRPSCEQDKERRQELELRVEELEEELSRRGRRSA